MRKYLALAVAGALLVPSLALADLSSTSTKRVEVRILPSMAVTTDSLAASVTPALQTGQIGINVPFRIDANTQFVMMQAFVTDLYKADQGGAGTSSPHFLTHTGAVNVTIAPSPDPEAGGGMVGANGPASLAYNNETQSTLAPDGLTWTFYKTAQGTYESGIRGRFSHDITLRAFWQNLNAELPQGLYSGWVKLFAQVVI
ncbi:MAG: hypothetical protein ACYDA8_06005 [Deferrisomatales bacterium]